MELKDAQTENNDMARMLVALGLTHAPDRMCCGLRKYGQGWAVYVGFQDTDDLSPVKGRSRV